MDDHGNRLPRIKTAPWRLGTTRRLQAQRPVSPALEPIGDAQLRRKLFEHLRRGHPCPLRIAVLPVVLGTTRALLLDLLDELHGDGLVATNRATVRGSVYLTLTTKGMSACP